MTARLHAMRRIAIAAGLALACAGEQAAEQPVCSAAALRPEPAEECSATREVAVYRRRVAATLADTMRWQVAPEVPLSVELDAESRVERICLPADAPPTPWGLRRDLARSAAELRAQGPGPACVAGTRIELESAGPGISVTTADPPEPALASCSGLRNQVCIEQYAPVCAVFPDGTRRTHSNACNACENSTVKGWFDGPCPIH